MLRHAARAVPWGRVALAAALVLVLLEIVRRDPWLLWPLQGAAAGLVAGATAWCFDEPLADVVDTAPRGTAWQALARCPAVLLPALAWWLGTARLGRTGTFGHERAVLLQGLAAAVLGAGLACRRRARGDAVPGLRIAALVVPVAAAWALVRPLGRHDVVFPYGTTTAAGWRASALAWGAIALLATVLLVVALADGPWWHLRRPRLAPARPLAGIS